MNRRPLLLSVCGVAAATVFVHQQLQAQDAGFRLTIVPESIGVSYNAPMSDYYVFFTGEPVRMTVKLINRTREEFVPPGKRPLEDQIVRSVRPRRNSQQEAAPTAAWSRVGAPRHAFDGTSPIPAKNHAEMRWSLHSSDAGEALAPGVYDVSVRFPLRQNQELSESIVVEVREPKTRADRMDSLMHAAIRARWDLRYSESQVLLKQLLALNPVSAIAYAELGEVLRAVGDCQGAQRAIDQALAIIKAGSDRESILFASQTSLSDWASGLKGTRQSCQ